MNIFAFFSIYISNSVISEWRKNMKRVQSACIIQTLHFLQKDEPDRALAEKMIAEEVRRYKAHLTQTGTKYKILSETPQPDGSVVIEIKKQYNASPVGSYLD